MSWTYLRLLYTVTFHPGYVPRGPQWQAQQSAKRKLGSSDKSSEDDGSQEQEKSNSGDVLSQPDDSTRTTGAPSGAQQSTAGQSTLWHAAQDLRTTADGEDFYLKDVYVCKGDGMPIWCSTCMIWKPDRAHHCREVDRCVRKMDHFCPWVGGVVSETSFNFFIQFTAWSLLFCIFNLVLLAVFVARYRRVTSTANVHWVIALCLAALFAIFSFGMTLSSLHFVLVNTTTIENLSRKTLVWDLAIRVPFPQALSPPTISFSTQQVLGPHMSAHLPGGEVTRTYAIRHSKPGDNPWDLGPLRNFRSVMGTRWYEWLFPISHSPCCDHSQEESQFEMGLVVENMRKEAGIHWAKDVHADSFSEKQQSDVVQRKRRRRRHSRFVVAGPEESAVRTTERVDGPQGETRDVADMV